MLLPSTQQDKVCRYLHFYHFCFNLFRFGISNLQNALTYIKPFKLFFTQKRAIFSSYFVYNSRYNYILLTLKGMNVESIKHKQQQTKRLTLFFS